MPSYRAFQIRKQHILANFKVPVWKQQKRERPRDQRPGMDPEHLANIRKLPCCLCGERRMISPHHLRSGPARKERGLGLKCTDRHTVPVCIPHHAEIERAGSRNEIAYFAGHGIDCHALAEGLWVRRGSVENMLRVLQAHQLAAAAQMARTSQPY
jgi:hypothetical protein